MDQKRFDDMLEQMDDVIEWHPTRAKNPDVYNSANRQTSWEVFTSELIRSTTS